MTKYSIKDLEFLSGIKAHTLRVWEQRYGMLKPMRSRTNIRNYDAEEMKYVLNVSLLHQDGFRISEISKMSRGEVRGKVLSLTESNLQQKSQIKALTLAMVDLDEERVEKILSSFILQNGFEATILKLILPFLKRLGILWQTGIINSAQEHFITNLIRQKIMVAIEGQVTPSGSSSTKFLLFLPEGERHELSLLVANFILRARNNRVTYLGADVPLKDLEEVYANKNPEFLVTAIMGVHPSKTVQAYFDEMNRKLENANVLVAGKQAVEKPEILPQDFYLIRSFAELRKIAEDPLILERLHEFRVGRKAQF